MGLNQYTWGRQGWHFIHAIALSYPQEPTSEQKQAASDFINSLKIILPCVFCAENFTKKVEEYPPKLDNAKDFFEWTVDIHNMVNKEHDKKELTYEEALKEFEKNSEQNLNPRIKLEVDNKVAIPMVAAGSGVVGFLLGYFLPKRN